MSSTAVIVLGIYKETVDVKEIRAFGDELEIITPDGTKLTVCKRNVVLINKPENVNRCVSCGEIIPEGKQVCPRCEASTERKEGVWVINPDGYYPYCNKCGYEPERPNIHNDNRTPYCANCGAKMRKEVEN